MIQLRLKRYLIFLSMIVVLFFTACGKSKTTTPDPDEGTVVTPPPDPGGDDNPPPPVLSDININQAILLDPIKIVNNRSDFAIMDSLIRYFDYAPKNSEVYLSIFLFDYKPLVDAVKKAQDRGVELHLILDYSRSESQSSNAATIPELSEYLKAPSKVITFKSDASTSSINHDKYVIFSEVDLPNGKAKDLVFSTSHNFITGGTKKIQDAVVTTNQGLYAAFKENWLDISERAESGMKNFEYTVRNIGDSIEAHFFPRRKNGSWDGKDTYIELLDKIEDYSTAKIKVVMSDWTRVEVAEKLTELQEKGAQVEVITKDKEGNAASIAELGKLEQAGGYVKIVDMSKTNTHSKITLISAKIDGKYQDLLCAGSHNYTANALRNNNEVLLVLKNSSLFPVYDAYFTDLKSKL